MTGGYEMEFQVFNTATNVCVGCVVADDIDTALNKAHSIYGVGTCVFDNTTGYCLY